MQTKFFPTKFFLKNRICFKQCIFFRNCEFCQLVRVVLFHIHFRFEAARFRNDFFRILNRIRPGSGSTTRPFPQCLLFFPSGRFLRGISWWGAGAAPPTPASRTDSRSSRSQPTAPSASALASPRKQPNHTSYTVMRIQDF